MAMPTLGLSLEALNEKAAVLRGHVVEMITAAKSGHPGGSLSAAELITALYFGGVLRHDPADPIDPERDRFIMSKGHAVPILYAALAEAGYFPVEAIDYAAQTGQPAAGSSLQGRFPVDGSLHRLAGAGAVGRHRDGDGGQAESGRLSRLRDAGRW